jgi:predicted RND superfamily exporter protein
MIVGSTILINFGIMGWLGIPLDIVTVLISSIGIGVGVDYSIHIYTRYQEERINYDPIQSVTKAIVYTGKAIVTNAGSVIAGFLILLLSSFPPFQYFGSLVTGTMFVASVSALTVLPALILLRWENKEKKAGKEVVSS